MRLTSRKIAVGILASAIGAGTAVANDWRRDNTNPFDPPHVYVTPPTTALGFSLPSSNGIPYRWKVNLGAREKVTFGGTVGAKSWWEPANPPATPGWTHTSNWVQLTLTASAYVTIQVGPNVPIPVVTPVLNGALAGSDLLPAISIYSGHDTTSAQDHTFNPTGNGWWSTVQYIDSSSLIHPVTHVLTYKRWLPAGKYTINIGGAGAKSPFCDMTKPCYSGSQSFQARIATSNSWQD